MPGSPRTIEMLDFVVNASANRGRANISIWMVIVGLLYLCFPQSAWSSPTTFRLYQQDSVSPPNNQGDETEDLDEDELRIIEMRRRALEMEMDEDSSDGFATPQGLPFSTDDLDAMTTLPGKLGPLPEHPDYPADNRPTAARIELGRKLYFDKRLSGNQSMSCATCHHPQKGWSDAVSLAEVRGHTLKRHSPTVINTAYNSVQFWDGRAATLEEQALGPILSPDEMNMPNEESVLEVIRNAKDYRGKFEEAYDQKLTYKLVGKAIAAFERTVVTGPSRFDEYMAGDKTALSESEKRGLILFTTTASCTACHQGSNFTDNKFHALGVKRNGPDLDFGRYTVTKDETERFCFKTPGLRNVAQTAPYMHDGSLNTLRDVVEFYDRGGDESVGRSKLIQPLNLTDSQKDDLVNFLKSLTGQLPNIQPPKGEHFGY